MVIATCRSNILPVSETEQLVCRWCQGGDCVQLQHVRCFVLQVYTPSVRSIGYWINPDP